MKVEQLEIGRKYQHANGICMFTGSIVMNEEDHAVFVFKSGSITYIPHHSLYLISALKEDLEFTDMIMEVTDPDLTDEELRELLNII